MYVQSTPFIVDTVGTSHLCPLSRESIIARVYFSQTSVICFCRGSAAVLIIGVFVIAGCSSVLLHEKLLQFDWLRAVVF